MEPQEKSIIKWPEKVEKLMLDMLVVTPPMYKKNARLIVQTATEQTTQANNRDTVSEEDLVITLLKITPPQFRGMLLKRSKEIGLDLEKYKST